MFVGRAFRSSNFNFLEPRKKRCSSLGMTEVDIHKCLTVDRSEGNSDGDTETEGRVARAASHRAFNCCFWKLLIELNGAILCTMS